MNKIMLICVLILLVTLTGCSFKEDICIEGKNLTYDGQYANGKVKVSVCNDKRPLIDYEIINETVDNETIENSFSMLR